MIPASRLGEVEPVLSEARNRLADLRLLAAADDQMVAARVLTGTADPALLIDLMLPARVVRHALRCRLLEAVHQLAALGVTFDEATAEDLPPTMPVAPAPRRRGRPPRSAAPAPEAMA